MVVMDIGPVRRRLTVEPVVSPVAAEPSPVREPAASELGPPEREVTEHAAPEHEAAPAART